MQTHENEFTRAYLGNYFNALFSIIFPSLSSIIRCPDIDSARQKFSKETYKWTSEKHGNGPRHYHGSIGSHHLEIYPKRKQQTSEMSLEFYFETNIFPEDFLIKSDLEILSLLDPENRRFVVGLQH